MFFKLNNPSASANANANEMRRLQHLRQIQLMQQRQQLLQQQQQQQQQQPNNMETVITTQTVSINLDETGDEDE